MRLRIGLFRGAWGPGPLVCGCCLRFWPIGPARRTVACTGARDQTTPQKRIRQQTDTIQSKIHRNVATHKKKWEKNIHPERKPAPSKKHQGTEEPGNCATSQETAHDTRQPHRRRHANKRTQYNPKSTGTSPHTKKKITTKKKKNINNVVTGFQQLQRAKHKPVSHLLNLRDCSKASSK